jgi:hypothetical protein
VLQLHAQLLGDRIAHVDVEADDLARGRIGKAQGSLLVSVAHTRAACLISASRSACAAVETSSETAAAAMAIQVLLKRPKVIFYPFPG